MKKNIYKIGCLVGWGCIIAAFFINLSFINLLGAGFFVLGATFFYNFYFNDGRSDFINSWWQDVFGFYCLLTGLYYQFGLGRFQLGWLLTVLSIVSVAIKYYYTKKKLRESNKGSPRFPFSNLN